MGKLTPEGIAFLKCNTSPADFSTEDFRGIPDSYEGKSLVKRHQLTNTLNVTALTPGEDGYIVTLPVPGVAFFIGSVGAGTLELYPVFYTDYASLFPVGREGEVVTRFRYASSVIEIIPTVNQMTWTGNLQITKGEVDLTPSLSSSGYIISGLGALVNTVKPDCVHPFNLGCYVPTRSTDDSYPFQSIMSNQTYAGTTFEPPTAGSEVTSITFPTISSVNFVGLGKQEVTVIKIPAYSATGNVGVVRTWACVEYQLNSASPFYEFAALSAPCDPLALQLLKQFYAEHSAAVPYYDNDTFWKRFVEWVHGASGLLSALPGPYGTAARGVNMITGVLR